MCIVYLSVHWVCMHAHTRVCMWGCIWIQRTTFGSRFSPSTVWVLGLSSLEKKKCLSLLSPLTARSRQTLEKAHIGCFQEPGHLILMNRHLPKSVVKRHQPLYRWVNKCSEGLAQTKAMRPVGSGTKINYLTLQKYFVRTCLLVYQYKD